MAADGGLYAYGPGVAFLLYGLIALWIVTWLLVIPLIFVCWYYGMFDSEEKKVSERLLAEDAAKITDDDFDF